MTHIQKAYSKRKIAIVALVGMVIIFAISAGFFIWQQKNTKTQAAPKKETAEQTSTRILREVSKIYALPKDEEPSVAAIEDSSKLNGQTFFDQAQDGDYLLVYPDAKLALIYRAQVGQLINVGPISSDEPSQ